MLNAFKIKPFDLEPIFAEWKDGPVFSGNPKKDLPVEEWLEKIKEGAVARGVPEEYWYKCAQHFMGPKAKARLEELKKVIVQVHGGKYRWTWKKFKLAMVNMGWNIDEDAKETIKVTRKGSNFWFNRKKDTTNTSTSKDSDSDSISVHSIHTEGVESSKSNSSSKRPAPPSRSGTLWFSSSKPIVEEPEDVDDTPPSPGTSMDDNFKPKLVRASTMSSFWPSKMNGNKTENERKATLKDDGKDKGKDDAKDNGKSKGKAKDKDLPARPANPKASSDTAVVLAKRKETKEANKKSLSPSRSKTTDTNSSHEGGEVVTTAQAPAWLLNACSALEFITSEHPKAMSIISAILITAGSIPAIPAIAAGAGGAVLASGTAHAIGAIAVGVGQALSAGIANQKKTTQEGHGSSTVH